MNSRPYHLDLTPDQLRALRMMLRWDLIASEMEFVQKQRRGEAFDDKTFVVRMTTFFDLMRALDAPLAKAEDMELAMYSFEMGEPSFLALRDVVNRDFTEVQAQFAQTQSEKAVCEGVEVHREALKLAFSDRKPDPAPFRFAQVTPQFKQ